MRQRAIARAGAWPAGAHKTVGSLEGRGHAQLSSSRSWRLQCLLWLLRPAPPRCVRDGRGANSVGHGRLGPGAPSRRGLAVPARAWLQALPLCTVRAAGTAVCRTQALPLTAPIDTALLQGHHVFCGAGQVRPLTCRLTSDLQA